MVFKHTKSALLCLLLIMVIVTSGVGVVTAQEESSDFEDGVWLADGNNIIFLDDNGNELVNFEAGTGINDFSYSSGYVSVAYDSGDIEFYDLDDTSQPIKSESLGQSVEGIERHNDNYIVYVRDTSLVNEHGLWSYKPDGTLISQEDNHETDSFIVLDGDYLELTVGTDPEGVVIHQTGGLYTVEIDEQSNIGDTIIGANTWSSIQPHTIIDESLDLYHIYRSTDEREVEVRSFPELGTPRDEFGNAIEPHWGDPFNYEDGVIGSVGGTGFGKAVVSDRSGNITYHEIWDIFEYNSPSDIIILDSFETGVSNVDMVSSTPSFTAVSSDSYMEVYTLTDNEIQPLAYTYNANDEIIQVRTFGEVESNSGECEFEIQDLDCLGFSDSMLVIFTNIGWFLIMVATMAAAAIGRMSNSNTAGSALFSIGMIALYLADVIPLYVMLVGLSMAVLIILNEQEKAQMSIQR